MRVSANTFSDTLITQLNNLSVRQQRLQSQAATGQRVRLPEDDPVALRRVLDMQSEFSSNGQYTRNIDRQLELAQASYNGIKSLKTISDRASEIATQVDDLKSPEELQFYAREITEMLKQAVHLLNATNRGDAIFGGTVTDQPPFNMTLDANGNVTAVTYQGNTAQAESEIAEDIMLSTQIVGENNTGSGPRGLVTDSRSGADLLNHLISLQNNLISGNTAAIAATDRGNLANDEDNLLYHISSNGAIQARLETTQALNAERGLAIEEQVSKEVDADLAQTLVKLSQTQTAYEAALQSGARALNLSLLDYLR
jgi:flagellar hook-associated protein 3 FlgL